MSVNHSVNEFYDGSDILSPFISITGLPIDQVRTASLGVVEGGSERKYLLMSIFHRIDYTQDRPARSLSFGYSQDNANQYSTNGNYIQIMNAGIFFPKTIRSLELSFPGSG